MGWVQESKGDGIMIKCIVSCGFALLLGVLVGCVSTDRSAEKPTREVDRTWTDADRRAVDEFAAAWEERTARMV